MKKTTCQASPDIAFVKYWGKKDEKLRLPENGSVSMVLHGLYTTTTVEFSDKLKQDQVWLQGKKAKGREIKRIIKHLDRIRKLADKNIFAKVKTENSFPRATGLSSSGSGFAALTLAATQALGLTLNQKQMSILARQASGTACRCVCSGFVQWLDGNTSQTSYSKTFASSDHWNLKDIVVVVDEGAKRVSSTKGHTMAGSSKFFKVRQKGMKSKIKKVKQAIKDKDLTQLGELIEAETLEFHSILLTSHPSIIAWYPGTIEVMLKVQELRDQGIEAYFTISTGFNVHVITDEQNFTQVKKHLKSLSLVKKVIEAGVGEGPKLIKNHLF